MSEQHLSEQLITCGSEMQRDREGLAKTNYTDLIDKWEQGPGPGHTEAAMLAEKHTHIKSHSHIFFTYCSPWQFERATKERGMSLTFP